MTAGVINVDYFAMIDPGGTLSFTTTTITSWVWVGN